MSTLYDIQGEYLRLYELATELDDPDSKEAFENALADLDTDLAVKAHGYAQVIKQLKMEESECDAIIEAFTAKKNARKNTIKRLEEAVIGAMDIAGKTELAAGAYTFRIRNNGGKQPMKIDMEKVPTNYMKIKYEPDKEKIRAALENGIPLKFAELEERGRHLNIK